MTVVDPDRLENRKPKLNKKKANSTFSSVGPNWVLSMGVDVLSTFMNPKLQNIASKQNNCIKLDMTQLYGNNCILSYILIKFLFS